jgi:hypothetical protein
LTSNWLAKEGVIQNPGQLEETIHASFNSRWDEEGGGVTRAPPPRGFQLISCPPPLPQPGREGADEHKAGGEGGVDISQGGDDEDRMFWPSRGTAD